MTSPAPLRWVFADGFAHLLADDGAADPAIYLALCGLIVPGTTPVYGVAPSLEVCRLCQRRQRQGVTAPVFDVEAPTFAHTPGEIDGVFSAPGRSSVEPEVQRTP